MSVTAEPEAVPVKPWWRGRIHQGAFFASLPAGAALIAISEGAAAHVAAICFALSLAALFGTSALYHRGNWTPHVRAKLQRADHAMIFVLIAGSYTPITLLAMQPAWGIALLAVVWTIAVVGVTLALSRFGVLSRVGGFMYIGMGWLVIIALADDRAVTRYHRAAADVRRRRALHARRDRAGDTAPESEARGSSATTRSGT